MLQTSQKNLIQDQITPQQKSTLKLLREAFRKNKGQVQNDQPQIKGQLKEVVSRMKVQKMKKYFYKKLSHNNIFRPPSKLQLQSDEQKNNRRLIKWKGLQLSQHVLSVVFLLQILFLLTTFVISSWMAFLPNFVKTGHYNSYAVVGVNAITAFFSFLKIFITSTNQTIKKGIIYVYVTDIFLEYVKSLIIFVDLIYLLNIILLSILRSASLEIKQLSIFLFLWSIIRIVISNANLTHFRTSFIDSFKKEQYYKLFKVVIFNFIFAHFIASMLLAMALINSQSNWMIAKKIQNQIWYVQYIWGYYWATTTMMTVGFGDFVPVNYVQGLIMSFLELFSCIVLAYNISEIGSIIATLRASNNQYIRQLGTFKRMAEQNEIDLELKIKIHDFLREQKTIKEKFEFNQQLELLERLPESLRKDFIMASNGKTFRYLPFFKNLQKNTLIQLVEIITSKVYYPGEAVVKAKQQTETLMILKEGKVGLIYRKENSLLNGVVVEEIEVKEREILTDGGKFVSKKTPILLTVQFLSPGKIINYDINALTYSYLFQIDHEKFMEIIKTSDLDKELFFSIVHSHNFTKSEWHQLPCQYCSASFDQEKSYFSKWGKKFLNNNQQISSLHFHNKFQCSSLHYMPHQDLIILKYINSRGKPQKSKTEYLRTKEKSSSCLLLRKNEFKTFEKTSLIRQKKKLQKFQEEVIVKKSNNNDKTNHKFSVFRNNREKENSNKSYKDRRKNMIMDDWMVEKEKEKKQAKEQIHYQDSDYFDKDQHFELQQISEDARTIIESVFKYALQQVYPHRFSLVLWDLEIDEMWNYSNYYSQNNAARLNKFELVKNRTHRNKALCLVGLTIQQLAVKDTSK